jgi:hypothetical protein
MPFVETTGAKLYFEESGGGYRAQLCDCGGNFPKELAGRANGALNLCHIAAAFVVQYATGVVLQYWTPEAGHYPEIAYRAAFSLNLAFQVAAWIWFVFPRVRTGSR